MEITYSAECLVYSEWESGMGNYEAGILVIHYKSLNIIQYF